MLFTFGAALGLGFGFLLALSVLLSGLIIAPMPAWYLPQRPLAESLKAY